MKLVQLIINHIQREMDGLFAAMWNVGKKSYSLFMLFNVNYVVTLLQTMKFLLYQIFDAPSKVQKTRKLDQGAEVSENKIIG